MNLLAVVLAQLLLFLRGPRPYGLLDVSAGIFAADHETDLAARVGWDRGVSIFGDREHLLAGLLQVLNQGEVQPLVFGCA